MASDMATSDYAARLEAFRQSDVERDDLVQEVIRKYEELKTLMWQADASRFEQALAQHAQVSGSNNFVLALLDGDGAIFQDALYATGKDGGHDAAHQLHKAIQDHLKTTYPKANVSDWSIVVQVVLNMQGLATKLAACGIVSNANEVPAFARAFGLAQPLFSFVDVGSGKERADHKIRETLRLYLPMSQCKHIFFGPCHDNGYLPVLERYRRDSDVKSRLTLIETRPAEPGFVELGFERILLRHIFRSDNLGALPSPAVMRSQMSSHSIPTSYIPPNLRSESPVLSVTPTNAAANSTPNSWATVGKTGPAGKTINIANTKASAVRRFVCLNSTNDRLDSELPRSDYGAESRYTERMKLHKKHCNSYHLTGKCDAGEYCNYYHGERLSPGELLVLKHKARSRSCPLRTACMDPDCTFGHVCKFGDMCSMGDGCYFAASHGLDLTPAKKLYDDGTVEWVPGYVNKFSGS